jgi:hypothetical protein
VQIGGNGGVEARRLRHHAGCHRVDQHLVARYVGIFGGDLTSHLVPGTMPKRWALDFVTTVKACAGRERAVIERKTQ